MITILFIYVVSFPGSVGGSMQFPQWKQQVQWQQLAEFNNPYACENARVKLRINTLASMCLPKGEKKT